LLEPSQTSATSQIPEAARQEVPALATASAGHAAELPVQYSATSHAPLASRHCAVEGMKLQLVVDWLGLHTWHAALGLVAPAA
jgi:hypothetical protein